MIVPPSLFTVVAAVKLRIKTLPEKLGYLTLSAHLKRLASDGRDENTIFHYQESLGVRIETGTIIGFESTEESVPISFGYINGPELVIDQLLTDRYHALEARIASQLPMVPRPYLSYNVDFVGAICNHAGCQIPEDQWLELQQPVPYIDEQGRWQSFNNALMKKEYYVSSPLIDFGKGKEIPSLWRAFLASTAPREQCEFLYAIIRHLRQSLLKELMLVMTLELPNARQHGDH